MRPPSIKNSTAAKDFFTKRTSKKEKEEAVKLTNAKQDEDTLYFYYDKDLSKGKIKGSNEDAFFKLQNLGNNFQRYQDFVTTKTPSNIKFKETSVECSQGNIEDSLKILNQEKRLKNLQCKSGEILCQLPQGNQC